MNNNRINSRVDKSEWNAIQASMFLEKLQTLDYEKLSYFLEQLDDKDVCKIIIKQLVMENARLKYGEITDPKKLKLALNDGWN